MQQMLHRLKAIEELEVNVALLVKLDPQFHMVRNELEAILVCLKELESREIEVALDHLDRKEKQVKQEYKGKKIMLVCVAQKVNRAQGGGGGGGGGGICRF